MCPNSNQGSTPENINTGDDETADVNNFTCNIIKLVVKKQFSKSKRKQKTEAERPSNHIIHTDANMSEGRIGNGKTKAKEIVDARGKQSDDPDFIEGGNNRRANQQNTQRNKKRRRKGKNLTAYGKMIEALYTSITNEVIFDCVDKEVLEDDEWQDERQEQQNLLLSISMILPASCAEHSYKNKSYSFQLPATSFQLPATSYQLSASSYQLVNRKPLAMVVHFVNILLYMTSFTKKVDIVAEFGFKLTVLVQSGSKMLKHSKPSTMLRLDQLDELVSRGPWRLMEDMFVLRVSTEVIKVHGSVDQFFDWSERMDIFFDCDRFAYKFHKVSLSADVLFYFVQALNSVAIPQTIIVANTLHVVVGKTRMPKYHNT
ncbi:hypothetical protein LXL04_005955 [Taraxacum kok-saghyz]